MKLKFIKFGITRTVILIGNYAVKLPTRRYTHDLFLLGCYSNWQERRYSKLSKGYEGNGWFSKIVPTLFCSWFGLISIQRRVTPLSDELTEIQWLEMMEFGERKKENYGYYNNKLVCVDYGHIT